MALSNHINPKSLKNIVWSTRTSRTIFEKEGQKVLENTSSHIDISQTKFNKSLFKSEELKGRSVKKFVSDELKIVNENVSLNWVLGHIDQTQMLLVLVRCRLVMIA